MKSAFEVKQKVFFIILMGLQLLKTESAPLKYFNDFQNQNFSMLWLEWTQIMEIKQNQTFYKILKSDIIFRWKQNAKYFNDFYIWHSFQFHCKSDHKQVTWNKIKRAMCEYDSIFFCLQSSILFKRLLKNWI